MSETRNEKILASITGFAVGDALGVPAEFKNREELEQDPITGMTGYGSHNMPAGTWSDDTSMVLATMDSIIETKGIDYDDMMKRFVRWFKDGEYTATGEVFDIGNTTHRALEKYMRGRKYTKCGSTSFYENGNGSLMRILPIAIYFALMDLPERREVETVYYVSSLTHGHDISLLGCKIYCDLYKKLLRGETIEEACQSLQKIDYDIFYDDVACYRRILDGSILSCSKDEINSTGYVVYTLEAAVWCVANSSSFEEAVLKAVNLGHDTDTVAAVTGSLAAVIYGYDSIPLKWRETLLREEMISEKAHEFLDTILSLNK